MTRNRAQDFVTGYDDIDHFCLLMTKQYLCLKAYFVIHCKILKTNIFNRIKNENRK